MLAVASYEWHIVFSSALTFWTEKLNSLARSYYLFKFVLSCVIGSQIRSSTKVMFRSCIEDGELSPSSKLSFVADQDGCRIWLGWRWAKKIYNFLHFGDLSYILVIFTGVWTVAQWTTSQRELNDGKGVTNEPGKCQVNCHHRPDGLLLHVRLEVLISYSVMTVVVQEGELLMYVLLCLQGGSQRGRVRISEGYCRRHPLPDQKEKVRIYLRHAPENVVVVICNCNLQL